jgi:hypothetical protein
MGLANTPPSASDKIDIFMLVLLILLDAPEY